MDTGAFIIRHLAEVAKVSNKNVISIGGTVIAIAIALGHSSKLPTLEPHFLGGHLDLGTLHHMHIIDTRGATIRYSHHGATLFTLPNVEHTTIANKRNWNYDCRIIRANVLSVEEQLPANKDAEYDEEEGEDDDEEEGNDVDAGRRGPAPKDIHVEEAAISSPQPPLHPPFHHEMGGFSSSSAAYMPLDPTFLHSFSALQIEVSSIRGDYTGLRDDFHHLSDRMDSFDAGITYFRGFADRQEERGQRRIQREEERAMREALEYEERRRMNELFWRQSESIRQMEERLRAF